MNSHAIRVLTAVPYLAGLEPDVLARVAQAAVRRELEPGQILLLEGESCQDLCVVESGWLKVIKVSAAGREQVLRVIGPGEVCNEIAVFTVTSNPATVVALEPVTVWLVERAAILRLMDRVPGVARAVTQNLAGRVLALLDLVEDLSLRGVEARLARTLLERAEDGVVQRQRWATQAEMAAQLGTVPDVLNRALRRLVEDDLIEVSRQQIRILDRACLVQRVDPVD